jgi:hypothetical protein
LALSVFSITPIYTKAYTKTYTKVVVLFVVLLVVLFAVIEFVSSMLILSERSVLPKGDGSNEK